MMKRFLFIAVLIIYTCSDETSGPDNKAVDLPNKLFDVTSSEIKAGSEFLEALSYFQYDVSIFKIAYPIAYKGNYILCSGVVAIPEGASKPSILIDVHGTLQHDAWAPSNAIPGDFIHRFSEFASAGYIVFAPDLIGFGESADEFHPWLLPEPGADAIVGIIDAGKDLLDEYNVEYDDKIFLTGFSEGANKALGAHRRIEQNVLNINLVASSLGSGAYDMDYTFTNRILGDTPDEAIGGAYIIITLREVYNWSDPLTAFFKQPYAGHLQDILDTPGTFEDNFFVENPVSIDYATGVLTHNTLYVDAFLQDFTTNSSNKVKQKLIENNIHMWKPNIPIMLHYGESDTTTYFQNSLNTYAEFINRGADPQKITIHGYPGKNHEGSENPWMKATLDWFSTF